MSLPDILLSLLREPMSGTDLVDLFDGTIRHFWKTDLSQIYKALEGLEREGSLRSRFVPSSRGPEKRVYSLTARGKKRLATWIHSVPRIPPTKFEYLAQVFSATADGDPKECARSLIASMRGEAARDLAVLESLDTQFRDMPGYPEAMPASIFYPWLTLRHGIARRRAFLEWIDESLEHLDARPDDADGATGTNAMAELIQALQRLMAEKA